MLGCVGDTLRPVEMMITTRPNVWKAEKRRGTLVAVDTVMIDNVNEQH
jgi:hypothetical protein